MTMMGAGADILFTVLKSCSVGEAEFSLITFKKRIFTTEARNLIWD